MRIGIDFHSAERKGSGNCTYIRNLVEALIKIDTSNEYLPHVALIMSNLKKLKKFIYVWIENLR